MIAADGPREGPRERRLADAGDVLDEHVAARDEGRERELDRVGLAFEGELDRGTEPLDRQRRRLFPERDGRRHRRGC